MEHGDFKRIAKYLNEINRALFTDEEVKMSALDYSIEYLYSVQQGKPTHVMKSLCQELYSDMDFMDYMDLPPFMNEVNDLQSLEYVLNGAMEFID